MAVFYPSINDFTLLSSNDLLLFLGIKKEPNRKNFKRVLSQKVVKQNYRYQIKTIMSTALIFVKIWF